ncbi:vacuolar ATP synthase subunit h, putative [Eimeria brunetti]|uniref:Vacuolar ATP synthase subunit h, putative n=1 Tax=Eimeria brunetti TaxID=51314 RepID=U6LL81_9EIME|nr:vacuolar ATP synthase subunit h, putative [Eimeria brunetti]
MTSPETASATPPKCGISHEQTEQVRLLNHLVKQELVLQRQPEWHLLERAGLIKKGMGEALGGLHALDAEQRADAIAENPAIVPALVAVLRLEADIHPAQYALTILYEVVRENSSRYEVMCKALEGTNLYEDFMQLLQRHGVDAYTGDRASFMLSGFMSRSRSTRFSDNEVEYFVQDRWRPVVWENRTLPELLVKNLSLMQPPSVVYKAVLCIVRVGLHVIENFLSCEEAVEIIIEENVAQILTLLEFEKWRDPDLYEEIRACIFSLDLKIRQFNNFERYLLELEKGKLRWSVLHSGEPGEVLA